MSTPKPIDPASALGQLGLNVCTEENGRSYYADGEGCYVEDVEQFLQTSVLGFCGCGCPDRNLQYVRRGLELIGDKCPHWEKHSDWLPGHRQREQEHFKTTEAAYFFYYWADKEGLTEHGGSVPGWLSTKGELLLAAIKEWEGEDAPDAS